MYIDDHVFRMHSKLTVIVLVLLSVLVLSMQSGDAPAIECKTNGTSHVSKKMMEMFCWIQPTHTTKAGDSSRHHWVWLALMAQAFMFSIPSCLWKSWEGGKIKKLARSLDMNSIRDQKYQGVGSLLIVGVTIFLYNSKEVPQWACFLLIMQVLMFFFVVSFLKSWARKMKNKLEPLCESLNVSLVLDEVKTKRRQKVVDYFSNTWNHQNYYVFRYFFCEALALVNVVAQIFWMDAFFDTSHSFPEEIDCNYPMFGSSGDIHARCVLPNNKFNQKVFIGLRFWFLLLAAFSALTVMYRLAVVLLPSFRLFLLRNTTWFASEQEVTIVANKCQIGDWFFLVLLSRNVSPFVFKDLIHDLAVRFEEIDKLECS